MGKNRDRESLIRLLVGTIVHEIVIRNTNRPESKHFLASEIVEYRGQTEKVANLHSWNEIDKKQIRTKAIKKIKEKLETKYPDVDYKEKDVKLFINKEMKDLGL